MGSTFQALGSIKTDYIGRTEGLISMPSASSGGPPAHMEGARQCVEWVPATG